MQQPVEAYPQYADEQAWSQQAYDAYQKQESSQITGSKIHFAVVFGLMVCYALVSFAIPNLETGNYAFKIAGGLVIFSLAFSRENRLALLGFAVPMYLPAKLSQTAMPGTDLMTEATAVFIILAWMIAVISDMGADRVKPNALVPKLLLGAWLIWAAIGLFASKNPYLWFSEYSVMLALPAAFGLAIRSPITPSTIKRMFLGLGVSIVTYQLAFALVTLVHAGAGALGELDNLRMLGKGMAATYVTGESALCVIALAFAVGLASSRVSRGLRWSAILFGIAPAGLAILLYITRSSMIVAGLVVLVSLLLSKRRRAALVVAMVMLLAVTVFVLRSPEYVQSVTSRFSHTGAGYDLRAGIRQDALRVAFEHPVFGVGIAQFKEYGETGIAHAHNEPLNIASEEGFPALMLYGALCLVIMIKVFKARKATTDPFRLSVLFGVAMAALAYALVTEANPLFFRRGGILMAGLLGMLYACSEPDSPPDPAYEYYDPADVQAYAQPANPGQG